MSIAPSPTLRARTKIVATVGPACDSVDMLVRLIHAGASVFRINTAHGTEADRMEMLAAIREARGIKVEEVKKNLTVLQELKGRIRSLKKEQAAALGAADPVKAARLRRRISQLKKKTRRPAA